MVTRLKRSGEWEYFVLQVTDDSKVSCSLCNAVISRGGKDTKNFNTSNMRYHLETKHPNEYKQLTAKDKESSRGKVGGSRGSNQPTLLDSFKKSQPLAFDHPRAKIITKRISEMMALDNEPFTMINHIGFVRLLNILEPRYQLPSDKYFSETLIPEMYQKVAFKLKNDVSSTLYVSLTTDVWSSVAQDSYISLTCHYVIEDFTQQQICLHAAPFNDHHTGERIGGMINKCLQSWDLTDKHTCGCEG